MHGRLKIKTTAQQEAEKKKERAVKLAGYRKAMGAILSRRKEGVRDEKQLKLTAGVLMANPDIHTLWNIRRECVESIICDIEKKTETDKSEGEDVADQGDAAKSEESKEEAGEKETEDVSGVSDGLWMKEVELTGQCLQTNPKSYGAWHHRCYSLDKMSSPPWTNELALCDKFLSMDERNFHCWDYRQIAAKRAERKPEAELDFTMDRINNNFSNYSAWHYRSKLLPRIHQSQAGLAEAVHHAELELVQNAAFTDPDDSSAWFYHTWLLGSQGQHRGPQLLSLNSDQGTLTVATSREVSSDQVRGSIGSEPVTWRPGPRFRTEWVCECAGAGQGARVSVSLGQETLELVTSDVRQVVTGPGLRDLKFTPAPSEATRKVFLEELDNCNQLIELEPDSKWPLYTRAMIMRSLDSEEYSQDILETLTRLVEVDPMRRGYYMDLREKVIIENLLEKASVSGDFETIDLSLHKVSKIFYRQYLNIFKEIKW